MRDFAFHPSLKISIYLAVVRYVSIPVLLLFLMYCFNQPLEFSSLLLLIIFCIFFFGWIAEDIHTRGLVILKLQGLEGYSFGILGSSNHFLRWEEIERVEPYRYFGLRFLLVRYYGSDTPLWLPLFLKYQIKFNLLILEYTTEDNPLHRALVQRGIFKQVPWHSRVKKYRSDRYILESAYSDKVYNCFAQYCLNILPILGILTGLNLLIFDGYYDRHFYISTGIIIFLGMGLILLWWQISVKDNYLAIKPEGIETCIKYWGNSNKSFIPWSEIERVEYWGWGICKKLIFILQDSVHGISFVTFPIHSLNLTKLRRIVMNQTHLENPLQQALIKLPQDK